MTCIKQFINQAFNNRLLMQVQIIVTLTSSYDSDKRKISDFFSYKKK